MPTQYTGEGIRSSTITTLNKPLPSSTETPPVTEPSLPHSKTNKSSSLSLADTKTTTASSLPGSIPQAKEGIATVRKIVPGKETKEEEERLPGYKPEYAGVQQSKLSGSVTTKDIGAAFIGTYGFRQKAVPELNIIRQTEFTYNKKVAQLQKAIDLQNKSLSTVAPLMNLREGLRGMVNFYQGAVLPLKEGGFLRDTRTDRASIGTSNISSASWYDPYLFRLFGTPKTFQTVQKVYQVTNPYTTIGMEAIRTVKEDIIQTGKSLYVGTPRLLAYSGYSQVYPVSEKQFVEKQKFEKETLAMPEVKTTAIIGGLGLLEVVPFGYVATAGITGYFSAKNLKESLANPTDVPAAVRTLEAGAFFLPSALRVARNIKIASIGKYVPPSEPFDINVLTGKNTFPRTTSPQYTLKSFLSLRETSTPVQAYNKFLIQEFKTNAPKGTIIKAMPNSSLLPNLAVVKIPVQSYVKGGKIPTLHVTPSSFGKAETIGRGASHEAGLFVTPYGKGSPYFTYLPEPLALPKISLIPELYNPEAILIRVGNVARIPGKILGTKGFEQVNIFLKGEVGKGTAYVTKRSEAAFNKSLAKGFSPTHELEAVIPEGTKIVSNVPGGNWLQKLAGFKTYTVYRGEFIPIKSYKVITGKSTPKIFKEQLEGFSRSSSSLAKIGRPVISLKKLSRLEKPEKSYSYQYKPIRPTIRPVLRPSIRETIRPASRPSIRPTVRPIIRPTGRPAARPVIRPTGRPVIRPLERPTVRPTERPTSRPVITPTGRPIIRPNIRPVVTPKITRLPPIKDVHIPKIKKQEKSIISKGIYAPSLVGVFDLIPKLKKIPKPSKSQIGLFSGISLRPGVETKIKVRHTPTTSIRGIGITNIKRSVTKNYVRKEISTRGLPKWMIA